MQQLAFDDARELVHQIHKTAENLHPHNIIILVHVPPFKENARHQGKLCEPTHLPFFLSKVTGDMIRRCASKYPHIDFQVLCGHTVSFYKPSRIWLSKQDHPFLANPLFKTLCSLIAQQSVQLWQVHTRIIGKHKKVGDMDYNDCQNIITHFNLGSVKKAPIKINGGYTFMYIK